MSTQAPVTRRATPPLLRLLVFGGLHVVPLLVSACGNGDGVTDPDPSEEEVLEPFTAEDFERVTEELEEMRPVDGDSDDRFVRTAIRWQLREELGVVYEPLTKTFDLPDDCTEIASVQVINQAGTIIDTQLSPLGENWGPGDAWGEDKTSHPDRIEYSVEYEFEEDADGNRRLRFTSPYSNRFLFSVLCVDEDGEGEVFRMDCSTEGDVVDENGEVVPEGDTSRPHAGQMMVLICGIPVEDLDARRRLREAIREAIRGMGAMEGWPNSGTTVGDDGNTYHYATERINQSDLSPEVLKERLEVIADAIGGEVRQIGDGPLLTLVGPGPCLME